MSEAMEWQGDNLLLTLERDPETILVRLFPAKYTPRRLYVFEAAAYRSKELERENAELRELVRDLLHHIEYPPCEGCLSEMSCAGDLSQCDEYFDWLKPRARELGVEVD